MSITQDISKSLRVATMAPLDSKSLFNTIEEMIDLGEQNSNAFTYYKGMQSICLENFLTYTWKEVAFGEQGLIPGGFSYPPNTIVDDYDYSGKFFNFILNPSSQGNIVTEYLEPSVNIEIKNEEEPEEALYFGTLDIGNGVVDVALVKDSFAFQSGYNLNSSNNLGDEVKIFSATTNRYLGQFKTTSLKYNNYFVLEIIEKGDWVLEGVFNIQKIIISLLKESAQTLNLSGTRVQILQGGSVVDEIDIGPLLPASTATIVSGVLNPTTGIVTFTLSNNDTFPVDFSALLNAADLLSRDENLAVKGKDIYENIFVLRAAFASLTGGYYAADISTNYNSVNFEGFPYPNNRNYVVCQYEGQFYLLIKKTSVNSRIFQNPNGVVSISFFNYAQAGKKSLKKIAYLKILTRQVLLQNLSVDFNAYLIWDKIEQNVQSPETSAPINETYLIDQVDSPGAHGIAVHLYEEQLPLDKDISMPYTLKNEDNGRILNFLNHGILTVPALKYGFECGFVQKSNNTNNVNIQASSGISILKPEDKLLRMKGQYYSAYLKSNQDFNPGDTFNNANQFILLGDLADA